MSEVSNEWHKDFFDETYHAFYRATLSDEQTQKEVDFLESVLGTTARHILDVPCGFGRHSIELARRGFSVVGVDKYESQLEIARKEAIGIQGVTFEENDMRTMMYSDFDAVIHMFSSFGYFSREEDTTVMRNMTQSVCAGGTIIIDVRNPVRLLQQMKLNNFRIEHSSASANYLELLDNDTQVLTMIYTHANITKKAKMNIYQPEVLTTMLNGFGCTVKKCYGNYDKSDFDRETSKRLIIIAQQTKQ